MNEHRTRMFGVYKALVAENFDPKGLGRLRVRHLQSETITDEQLPWAEYCTPLGGGNAAEGAGAFFIPHRGDTVWISYEGGDITKPVWLGSAFFNEEGKQNPPMEAKVKSVEPLNRIIKTPYGNKLELDDRLHDVTGNPTRGARLTSGLGKKLELDDAGNVVRLSSHAAQPHLLEFNAAGIKLQTARGGGVFIDDRHDRSTLLLLNSTAKSGILLSDDTLRMMTPGAMDFNPNFFSVDAPAGYLFRTQGLIDWRGNAFKVITSGDTTFSPGNNFQAVVPGNTRFLGGPLGNFIVQMPVIGIPKTSGIIDLNTASGTVVLRVGAQVPMPLTPAGFDVSLAELNDPLQAPAATPFTKAARLALGQTGAIALDGPLGGVWLSPIPIPHPGSALGLGGRPMGGAPYQPIIGAPVPGVGPQPAVLGGNLYNLLTTLFTALQTLAAAMTASTPAFTLTLGALPSILNPAVGAALAAFLATLTTAQLAFMGPPGVPTNILSSVVHVDG